MDGGAFGAGKAGSSVDPLEFVRRPQVIARILCWLFAIIIFGSISSKGWAFDKVQNREVCLFNKDLNACNYGTTIAVFAFLAAIGFLAGEWFFQQISSVKMRRRYIMLDFGFSAFWTFLYFVGFCYLTSQWSKSETPEGGSVITNGLQAAIAFSFFSIFSWAGCTWFAYQRYKLGVELLSFIENFGDASFFTRISRDSGSPVFSVPADWTSTQPSSMQQRE
nr:EOG090X0FHR [Artemia franciscana]